MTPIDDIDIVDRFVSPLGDQRERSVLCTGCQRPGVWALDARCDECASKAAS